MKKDELIETALALGIQKKDLAGKNKGEIEALIAAANDKKPEDDGSILLGGETSPPSEEPMADAAPAPVQEGPAGTPPAEGSDGAPAPESKPVAQRIIGKHPVTGNPVYAVVE